MLRWLKGGLWFTAGAALFLVLCGVSAALHVRLPVGRRALADVIEQVLDREIAGSASIGELLAVPPGPIVVRELVFRDAARETVIRIVHAEVELDVWALFSRRIQIHRARVRSAAVFLTVDDEGEVNLDSAFSSGRPDDNDDEGKQLHIGIHSVHFDDLRFVADAGRGPTMVVEDMTGFVAIVRRPEEAVRVRLDRVSGRVSRPRPLGLELTLDRVDGVIRAQHPEHVVELTFAGELDDRPIRGSVDYRPNRDEPVDLTLELRDANLRGRLLAFGGRVFGAFSGAVDADIDVSGAP